MAVPLHGDHRARHVLRPAARAPRWTRATGGIALGTIAALGLGTGLGACGAGTAPADVAGAADAAVGTDRDGSRAALGALLGAGGPDASGSSGASGSTPSGPPSWPADFRTHPDAPLEAREWLAVLRDGDGTVWGLRQRLVRVRVPGAGEASPVADDAGTASSWRYAAVLRADGALERADGRPLTWSATEREAVGLAGPVGEPVDDPADGSGTDAAAGRGLEVLGHAVASAGALPATGCDVAWALVVPGLARLTGTADGCPVGGRVAGTAAATLGPFPVSGTLRRGADDGDEGDAGDEGDEGDEGGAANAVSGIAWQRLAWGAVPALGGGAVVFDRAVLALEGVGGVELVRSRRASGRGVPRTTLAPLDARARRAGALDSLAVEWSDPATALAGDPAVAPGPDGEGDGGDARGAGRLRVPALGIDVRLRALSPVVATDDGLERAFRGAVVAEGTHRGVGFVEHRPLAPAADDAVTGDGAAGGTRAGTGGGTGGGTEGART